MYIWAAIFAIWTLAVWLHGHRMGAATKDCEACRLTREATRSLRQKCVEKYGDTIVQTFHERFDPTTPTARELDAQWGFNKTRKGE